MTSSTAGITLQSPYHHAGHFYPAAFVNGRLILIDISEESRLGENLLKVVTPGSLDRPIRNLRCVGQITTFYPTSTTDRVNAYCKELMEAVFQNCPSALQTHLEPLYFVTNVGQTNYNGARDIEDVVTTTVYEQVLDSRPSSPSSEDTEAVVTSMIQGERVDTSEDWST